MNKHSKQAQFQPTAQHTGHRPDDRRSARPGMAIHHHQRGVATILVISSLLVLTLIGFALITVVTYQKMASGAASTVIGKNENIDASLNMIREKIQQDLLRHYSGVNENGLALGAVEELPNAYASHGMTYPNSYKKWLASTEPYDTALGTDSDGDGDTGNDFMRWRQISLIADSDLASPATSFVNISNMQPLGGGVTQGDLLYNAVSPFIDADTDGDGFADARWVTLGTPQSDGTVTAMAVRVIDNGSMLNLNTISNVVGGSDVPLGRTPADICLFYPLYYADGSPTTWGTEFRPIDFVPGANPGNTNWASFFALKGLSTIPSSQVTRFNYWTAFGSRQNQAFGLYPNTTVFNNRVPLGMQDEMELRLLAGRNSSNRSMLENTLDRASNSLTSAGDSGPFRSYFPQSLATTPLRNREDRRRLFTTINGTHAVRVPALVAESGSVEFREPMPLWLSEINAVTTVPGSPANTPQGVPFFKLNPNRDSPARLAYLFENLLKQNAYLVARYPAIGTSNEIIYPDATNTAYMLAANLARYRLVNTSATPPAGTLFPSYTINDDQVYNPTLAQVASPDGSKTFYGLALQPFFTMVAYSEVYKDPNDDGQILFGDQVPGTFAPTQKLFAAELRNPFPVPVDLSKFAIRYNGSLMNISSSQRLLDPGDYVVVHTDDVNWVKVFSTSVPASKRVAISISANDHGSVAADYLEAFPLDTSLGNGTFELVALSAPTVVIDRIRNSAGNESWMRPAYPVPGDPSDYPILLPATGASPPYYNFSQSLCFLQRWWTPDNTNSPTSSTGLGNGMAQSYMLENQATNDDTNPVSDDANTGRYRNVAGTNSTEFTPSGDITGPVLSRMGNTDPSDPATAIAKTGTIPTVPGFTQWPAFQISYPFAYDSSTPSSSTFGGEITNLAEVLNIVTVSHTATHTFSENLAQRYTNPVPAPSVTTPSLGSLPPILHYGQVPPPGTPTARNMGWDGAGYTVPLIRTASPRLPLSTTIIGALDLLTQADTGNQQPFIAGTVNINTAPAEVMESLPFMYRWDNATVGRATSYNQWFGTRGIVGYRDSVNLSGLSGSLPSSTTDRAVSPAGPNFSDRPNATSINGLRTEPGFATPSELLMVRSINTGNNDWFYTMNALALDNSTVPGGVIDSSTDQIIDDSEEDSLVYGKISNLVTNRSDVYTAWVMLKNQKHNPLAPTSPIDPLNPPFKTVSTTRYVATILRGVVVASGNDGELSISGTTTTLTIPNTALPTGYQGSWLVGKDVKLRYRTGPAIDAPTQTLSARITGCTGSGPYVLTLRVNTGAFSAAPTGGSGWEYQIVDQPRVLGFTQSK